jgi:hypothetical protein
MSRPDVVIDARMSGPRGPLAQERLNGQSVLAHLLDTASKAGLDAQSISGILLPEDRESSWCIRLNSRAIPAISTPPEQALVLRCDRLYDPRSLRKVLRTLGDPEQAVFWRLDRPELLAVASDELVRRTTFQPLGKYWALAPARRLARWLAPTCVRPNAVTLTAALLMLSAALGIAFGSGQLMMQIAAAAALALALILDTADGHLARLQGSASLFGRWLDSNLDELSDAALHVAAAWAAAIRFHQPLWLVIGMIYLAGKYLFFFGSLTWDQAREPAPLQETREQPPPPSGSLRRLVELAGHADLRWHLWILLALLGRMEFALAAYAAYFPLRVLAGFIRKARSLAHA